MFCPRCGAKNENGATFCVGCGNILSKPEPGTHAPNQPLSDRLVEMSRQFPAPFERQKDGALKLECKLAERKVFLSSKTLKYQAKARVDDEKKTVRFFETLRETGVGMASSSDDVSPGFGFKVETYKTTVKARAGSIEELSRLFGKDYKYSWDYSTVRKVIEQEARNAGFSLSLCLMESSV